MYRCAILAAPLTLLASTIAQAQAGNCVNANGMSVRYEVSGRGTPLVVLHGAYTNVPDTAPILATLARTRCVDALEFQGRGMSQRRHAEKLPTVSTTIGER